MKIVIVTGIVQVILRLLTIRCFCEAAVDEQQPNSVNFCWKITPTLCNSVLYYERLSLPVSLHIYTYIYAISNHSLSSTTIL